MSKKPITDTTLTDGAAEGAVSAQRNSERRRYGKERLAPLGPVLRLIQIYYVLLMAFLLFYALFKPEDEFSYDLTLVRIMVLMMTSSLSVWLIQKRASITRKFILISLPIAMAVSAIDIVFGTEHARIAQMTGLLPLAVSGALYYAASAFILCYFAFSRWVRQVFIRPLSSTEAPVWTGTSMIGEKPFTWPWVRNLVLYYCIFTILGHWAEIAFCWLIVLGVFMGEYDFSHAQLWSQWLTPYPAHGIALVLIVLLLYPFKEWLLKKFNWRVFPALVASFLANALVCTSIDFFTGITANADYQLWDYRDMPFNFMGQICLQNSVVYSLAATLIVWVIYPLMARFLHKIPKGAADAIFFAVIGFYAFLEVLYYVDLGPTGLVFG